MNDFTASVANLTRSTKKPWEPPVIRPVQMTGLNKFGKRSQSGEQPRDTLEGRSVKALLARYGSPLFVTSEQRLRENVRDLMRAFQSRYPQVIHGWSYKTNYTSAVCNILHQEGSWAEVVSAFEYAKARCLGVPGSRIIYNGPHKTRDSLIQAIHEGARIHLDNFDELTEVESLARQLGQVAPVALRLNFDTGYTDPWSRFGFNLESGEARDAAVRVIRSPHLHLQGLHSHIGTFILDVRAYQAQVRILCTFLKELEAHYDCELEYLDIGGGFASRNALQGIYLPPEQVVPGFDQYAEVICTTLRHELREREAQGRALPCLILESGRAVVDDAQVLITSVVANKALPDGRRGVVLDAGLNVLFTGFWYNHKVQQTRPDRGYPEETVLYGPLCMNIDVVRHSISLPPLVPGDSLVVSPVGAYNNTQWMQFIEYRPAVVLLHEASDQVSVIRQAESLEVMNAQDRLPEHLLGLERQGAARAEATASSASRRLDAGSAFPALSQE